MTDIVEQLRALARAEHDDLSVADEAADTIEQLRARIAELEGAIGELVLEVKGWQDSAAKALAAANKALAELQRRNDETAAAIRERTDGR